MWGGPITATNTESVLITDTVRTHNVLTYFSRIRRVREFTDRMELNRWTPVQVGWMFAVPAVVAMVLVRALWQLGGRLITGT